MFIVVGYLRTWVPQNPFSLIFYRCLPTTPRPQNPKTKNHFMPYVQLEFGAFPISNGCWSHKLSCNLKASQQTKNINYMKRWGLSFWVILELNHIQFMVETLPIICKYLPLEQFRRCALTIGRQWFILSKLALFVWELDSTIWSWPLF